MGGLDRHFLHDLFANAVIMGSPIVWIGILVQPDGAGNRADQLIHPANASMEITARLILLGHEVDASAERLDEAAIGGSEIGIDHRREGDSLALGDHGESYG